MSLSKRRSAVVSLLITLAAGAALTIVAVPSASASLPGRIYQVRPGDLVDPHGTEGAATMTFLDQGVHVQTTSTTDDLAVATFPLKTAISLPQVTLNETWYGTTAQPAVHYDIDLDGDGLADAELVGEKAYGGTDLWLNPGFPSTTLSQAAIAAAAPCDDTTARGPQSDCAVSHGGRYHGSAIDWTQAFSGVGWNAMIVAGGFVASGAVMDGVLISLGYGFDSYRLGDPPLINPDITIEADQTVVDPGTDVTIHGDISDYSNYPSAALQVQQPDGSWSTVSSKTFNNSAGGYVFDYTPTTPGTVQLRVTAPPTDVTKAGTSPTLTLTVRSPARAAVTVTASAVKDAVRPRHQVRVTGTATPAGSGATVSLQRHENGSWQTVATETLPASGAFALATKAPRRGKLALRVTVSETAGTTAATSGVVRVKVKR